MKLPMGIGFECRRLNSLSQAWERVGVRVESRQERQSSLRSLPSPSLSPPGRGDFLNAL
jgi:hypothetical protein